MDCNMEYEVRRRMSQYRKRKWQGVGILVLAIAYLYYTNFNVDYRVRWIVGGIPYFLLVLSIFFTYAILAAVSIVVIRSGGIQISRILTDECDPFLYEACLNSSRIWMFKDRVVCNRAMAQYYQGNFEAAWQTLQRVQVKKLKGSFKINYYMILSSLYFRNGMGGKVRELEEAYRLSMKSGRRNRREQKFFQMLCAGNNYHRAMENRDYESAFRFVQERKTLSFSMNHTWNEVGLVMMESRIFLGLGEKESARLKLQYVMDKGGRLYYVKEAEEILAGL